MMNSQLLIGGTHKMEDTPQFRSALEKRQLMLMKEFDQKLQEFDSDRDTIDHDFKYKTLLLKQRDIMVALTTKLNERDEALVQLQDQVEVYEKVYKEHEDVIKTLKEGYQNFEIVLKNNKIILPNNLKENNDKIIALMNENNKFLSNISSLKNNNFNNSKGFGKFRISNMQDKQYVPYQVEKNEEGN